MDINLFMKMFNDKHFCDYKKMKYKYGENFGDFLTALREFYYKELPLSDFDGKSVVFIETAASLKQNTVKLLLQSQDGGYGIKAAEDEIIATSAIESIDFSRDSVRKILRGMAPENSPEERILAQKRGVEFIADSKNKITEENLYKLYMLTVGGFLGEDESLKEGHFYRHDAVYVVGSSIEHLGLDFKKVRVFMKNLVAFANADDGINDLIKASIIHFYIAFVHSYFDGNGRMARLVHLWFLIQKGYRAALFVPFSSRIEKTKKAYYDAFSYVEENKKYSGRIDVTPFILYFINNVYNKMGDGISFEKNSDTFCEAQKNGEITEKETALWHFVVAVYGTGEFSTKQLEKDFGNAAYATVRGFVLKFERLGLLSSVKYGKRIKYKVK